MGPGKSLPHGLLGTAGFGGREQAACLGGVVQRWAQTPKVLKGALAQTP